MADWPRQWLALHGWGENHSYYARLAQLLPRGCLLHAADMPGYGASPALPQLNLVSISAALEDTVAAMPAAPLGLMGNCGGALFALYAALASPRPISRILLIDPFAYMPLYFRLLDWPFAGPLCYAAAFANPLGRSITNQVLSHRRRPETDIMAAFASSNHRVNLAYLRVHSAMRLSHFEGLSAPVEIAYGAHTFAAVRAGLRLWQRLWPTARLHELPDCGHMPLSEAPEALARIVSGMACADGVR